MIKKFRKLSLLEFTISLGYLTAIVFIPLYLIDYIKLSKESTAIIIFIGTLFARLSRLFFSPFLDKLPPRLLLCALHLAGSLGYVILASSCSQEPMYFALILIGIFYSSTFIMARALLLNEEKTIQSNNSSQQLSLKFSWINSLTNLFNLATTLFFYAFYSLENKRIPFFIVSSILAFTSFILLYVFKNETIPLQHHLLKSLFYLVRKTKILFVMLMTVLGWITFKGILVYGTLALSHYQSSFQYGGMAPTLNILVILFFSIGITKFLNKHPTTFSHKMFLSFFLYFLSILLLIMPSCDFIFLIMLSIVIMSFGEVIFVTAYQTAFALNCTENQRIASLNVMSIAVSIGDCVGSTLGVLLSPS